MTTIAFDGKTLAADRATFQCNIFIGETVKVARRSDGAMVGTCGDSALGAAFKRWFLDDEQGTGPGLGDKDNSASALVIRPDGRIERHEYTGWFAVVGPLAIGGGQELALGAMEAGATAVLAVAIATRRVGGDPNKLDAFDLEPQPLRLVQP